MCLCQASLMRSGIYFFTCLYAKKETAQLETMVAKIERKELRGPTFLGALFGGCSAIEINLNKSFVQDCMHPHGVLGLEHKGD